MDFGALLDELEKVSLFDLWRLKAAIDRALEDPRKNEAIRARLSVGQDIRYFDAKGNREIAGRIVEIKRSRCLIQHEHDQKLWYIPFYMIHLEGAELDSRRSRVGGKVRRDSIQVGDLVSYRSRQNLDVYGLVVKLNPKTAVVQLPDGERWKVSYDLLSYVLDAEEAEASRHGALQSMLERAPSGQAPKFEGPEGPE